MSDNFKSEDFKPVGSIAFFILLVLICMAIWFGLYAIMLQKA